MDISLRQLRYFVKVVETGNMTRAAEQLFVAQPALGMQIRLLEEDLGVTLVTRHSRGITPTGAGALLHARALEIIKLVDGTLKEVAAFDRETVESVRLGMTPALMLLIGPGLAVDVRERHPQVMLSMVEAMSHVLVESLSRGELDLALAYDVPNVPHLSRLAVYQEDLVLVTRPGPAGDSAVTFGDALKEELALPERGDSVRDHVMRTAREIGLEPRVAFEVRSITAIKTLIVRGEAAGILPYGVVLDEVRSGALAARPIVGPPLRRTLFIAWPRNGALRSELALRGAIRASLLRLTTVLGPVAQPLPAIDQET